MPINADVAYVNAERDYQKAQTKEEKLAALKNMLATAPKHKGAEKLLKQIKDRIAKLKDETEKEAKQKKGSRSFTIKKEGAAQIVFVGPPNSGKSYVLEKLSSSPVEQKEYPFSTQEPKVKMIDLDGAKMQGIEIPAMYRGFYTSERGPELFAIIRNADLVVLVVDGRGDVKKQVEEICSEFSSAEVELTRSRKAQEGFTTYIPAVVLVNFAGFFANLEHFDAINFKESQSENVRKELWAHLPLIRIYTKAGGVVAEKPIVMRKGAIIREVAEKVHKDFVKNFKYAKIWGSGAFPGQQVGIDYILHDKDVVEIYTN